MGFRAPRGEMRALPVQQDLIFGGDHYPIAVDFDVRWDPAHAVERRQWKEADWDTWAAALKLLNQQQCLIFPHNAPCLLSGYHRPS